MMKFRPNTILLILPTIILSTVLFGYLHLHKSGHYNNLAEKLFHHDGNRLIYPNISEEISADGNYGRKYFAWVSESWPSEAVNTSVCLATQGTANYLHWVELHARLWTGPISVGVYTPGIDFMAAYNRITYLRKCYPAVKDLVSFHIVFPEKIPPIFRANDVIDIDCQPEKVENVFDTILMAKLSVHSMEHYPQNHVRNTARNACPTNYTMTTDIDMIPWDGMSDQMNSFFSEIELENCAYIVPVYEIHSDVGIFPPLGKQELLSLLKDKQARIFHSTVYKPNQHNSNQPAWEKNTSTNETRITISHAINKYEEYWEPILVLHSSAPKFFERFIGYGFTRSTHVYYLNLLHFHFYVLDNAFLSHLGFQEKSIYKMYRKNELAANSKLYTKFKKEMARRYKN